MSDTVPYRDNFRDRVVVKMTNLLLRAATKEYRDRLHAVILRGFIGFDEDRRVT